MVKHQLVRTAHITAITLVRGIALLAASSLTWAGLTWPGLTWAGDTPIAVIYPDIGEPYREIFEQIIEGIESNTDVPPIKYALRPNDDSADMVASLRQKNIKVAIALGRQGMKAAAALDSGIGVITGGVLNVPQNGVREALVVSLSPDPALMFSRLKSLMPSVKRIFVIYDPDINDWLIKLAAEAAQAQGLELAAYEAHDVRNAVKLYQEIFSKADNRTDAFWLPQDTSTVEEGSILPLVLQESWNQSIAVFSSNVGHVRRGALFSLYPDNVAMGKTLSRIAQNFLTTKAFDKLGMMPLRDVQISVNLRTAKHLGLNVRNQQNFNQIIPE